ncbi:hypothetical protein LXL04_026836 [Taraxacum kok-saghyz]
MVTPHVPLCPIRFTYQIDTLLRRFPLLFHLLSLSFVSLPNFPKLLSLIFYVRFFNKVEDVAETVERHQLKIE